MLGSEPVIGYESIGSCTGSNVAYEVPVGLGRSPVEPAAMQVKHRSSFLAVCGPRPPAGNSSDRIGLKRDAPRSGDAFNDGVERAASGTPFELTLHAGDRIAQGGNRRGIFRPERMDCRPGIGGSVVLADCC
jgi:hypothetical protein